MRNDCQLTLKPLVMAVAAAVMLYSAGALASSVALDGTDNLLWVAGTGITKDSASTALLSEITSSVTVIPGAVSTSLSGLSSAIAAYATTPSAANKTALQAAIAAYNETVTAAQGNTATAGGSGGTLPTIMFADDVTLDGASGTSQALRLSGSVLSIAVATGKTLTITNGTASVLTVSSGGLFAQTGDGNVAFTNNTASTNGGAIYNAGTVTLGAGSVFSGNTAGIYGIPIYKNGGAIYNAGTVTLGAGSVFSGNTAGAYGGAIYNSGTITLGDDATFSGNAAHGYGYGGGAIYNSGTITLGDDATFSGNTAHGYSHGGGAIYNSGTITLGDDATFSGNTALSYGHGGAIDNSGTITLGAGSVFSGNTGGVDGYGGAIYNSGTITLGDDATFLGNTVNSYGGGAIYNSGTITFGAGSVFSGNTSGRNGGAINSSGTITFGAGSVFSGNTAGFRGGAIFDNGGTVTLQTSASGNASQFADNTASSSANSVYVTKGATLEVTGDGVLDMLDPMAGTTGTVTQDGGTWYLGGATSFTGAATISVNSGNLYLYGDGQSSLTNAEDSSGVISATTGSITADSSGSSFTLGSGATLTAGGVNNAISMSAGTITLSNNAILAFNLAANDDSGDPMLNLTANSISVGKNLTVNLISDASSGTYTLLYGSQSGFLDGTTIALTAAGQAIGDVDFLRGYTGYVDGNYYKLIAGKLTWYGTSVSSSGAVQAHGTFTLDSGTFTVSTVLADRDAGTYLNDWDGKSLTKAGEGTLVLGAENTYTGATLVNAGTLKTGVANALASTSGVTVAPGATLDLGGNSQTIAQLNNSGTVLINDEDASALSSPVTVTGDMVNSGTLVLNNCSSCAGQTYIQDGNWVGKGGTVALGTVLNGDDSQTDKLVITGAATGTTYVKVGSEGGRGAQTLEGIEVIGTGSSTANAFVQNGRIVQGSYEYHLRQGTTSGAHTNNWYLTSVYGGPTATTYIRRPEAGIYAGNLAAAGTLFDTQLSDRQSAGSYIDPLTGKAHETSMWLRATGGSQHAGMSDGQTQFTTHQGMLQLGGDVLNKSLRNGEGFHAGAMAGYGYLSSYASNSLSGYGAKGQVSGYSAGLYGTWYQNEQNRTGLYVDSWLLYNVFYNTVEGDQLTPESYNSRGVTASLESGYTFHVLNHTTVAGAQDDVFIRPQAQLVWSGVRADDHTESNGTLVQAEGSGNVQTRLGVRVSMRRQGQPDRKGVSREIEPFAEANWLYRTKQYGVSMDGTSSYIEGGRNVAEMKVGVTGNLGNGFSLSGNLALLMGTQGYRYIGGSVQAKYRF